jgi:threonine aldolase
LADGLAAIPGLKLNPDAIESNIVFFELDDEIPWSAGEVVVRLRERSGILLGESGRRRFRAVTHYWVGQPEADCLLEQLRLVLMGR